MNTPELIVKEYYENIGKLYTRTNIKIFGQSELDLIGIRISNNDLQYYHIETTVSIADGFNKISNSKYDFNSEKDRQKAATQKKTAGYFITKKFYSDDVLQTYKKLSIDSSKLVRIIVAWDFDKEAIKTLSKKNIFVKSMQEIIQELLDFTSLETANLDSEILKTLQLLVRVNLNMPKIYTNSTARKKRKLRDSQELENVLYHKIT